ncbi:MAG: hypothetical protein HQM16_14945 [Deltaproteobacteria bacterium]|nr:hypothetical protein [Deltaproteobacteria bacterium]
MNKLLTVLFILFLLCVSLGTQAQIDAGMKISDPERGIEFAAPNAIWGINAGKHSISLNHDVYYDAQVTIKKSWFTVATAEEAYSKRLESLKSYLPGAIFIKENDPVTLAGNTTGLSMIYKNPSDLKVKREIMFIHRGQPYELVFQAKEENFQKVKEDFGYILNNMKLF